MRLFSRVFSSAVPSTATSEKNRVFHTIHCSSGGLFLLHFPGSRLRLTLSATVPCEARTFLTVIPFGIIPRGRSAELLSNYTTKAPLCQARLLFLSFGFQYHISQTSKRGRLNHRPFVKSGIACGAPPCAIDISESTETACHVAASYTSIGIRSPF